MKPAALLSLLLQGLGSLAHAGALLWSLLRGCLLLAVVLLLLVGAASCAGVGWVAARITADLGPHPRPLVLSAPCGWLAPAIQSEAPAALVEARHG